LPAAAADGTVAYPLSGVLSSLDANPRVAIQTGLHDNPGAMDDLGTERRLVKIVRVNAEDRDWVAALLRRHWGSAMIVSRGRQHDGTRLPGFVVLYRKKRAGLITYRIENDECEIVSLNSLIWNRGIGGALIEAVRVEACKAGCRRLWLITTNDNLLALRFYQKRGFILWRLHRGAIADSRKLKPEIPLLADSGIPIRDEVELQMRLHPDTP
jgi:N-acetylglutamate synthase-like GNAT family acetyltransferase